VLARYNLRNRGTSADLEDLVQDTFAGLFSNRALGAWDPERGLGLLGFVGLLAEREVGMAMRTRKRNPWSEEPTPHELLSDLGGATPSLAGHIEARDELRRLFARARARLRGPARCYLEWLVLEERSIQAVAEQTGSSTEALYAWRSRLLRLLRALRRELAAAGRDGAPHLRAETARRDRRPARRATG
jgi:RNA polymerase sigma-70 factor (ECF subfamily)